MTYSGTQAWGISRVIARVTRHPFGQGKGLIDGALQAANAASLFHTRDRPRPLWRLVYESQLAGRDRTAFTTLQMENEGDWVDFFAGLGEAVIQLFLGFTTE